MSAAIDRVHAQAQDRAARLRREAADLLGEVLPGVRIDIEGDTLRLTGRQVQRRWDSIAADLLLRSQLR